MELPKFPNRRELAANKFELSSKERQIITDLRPPVESLLHQMADQFEAGTYGLIIGDDASGRIPTLVLGKVIQAIYEKNGKETPVVRFLAGSRGIMRGSANLPTLQAKKAKLSSQIVKMKETIVREERQLGKCLIITDTISTGSTVKLLVEILRANGVEPEVASIGSFGTTGVTALREDAKVPVFVGVPDKIASIDSIGAHNTVKSQLTGVIKDYDHLFARPRPKEDDKYAFATRKLAKEMAQEIADEYLHKKEKPQSGA